MERIADLFFRFNVKLDKNKFLQAIKQAFVMMIPIFMVGSFAVLLQNFPILEIRNGIRTLFGGFIYSFLSLIYNATFGFAAVYVVITLTYHYSSNLSDNLAIRVFSIINSLVCYFCSLGPSVLSDGTKFFDYTNMTNVFSCLIVSFISIKIFFFWINFFNKNKNKALYNSNFSYGLRSLIPIILSSVSISVVACLIDLIPSNDFCNFNDLIFYVLSKPFDFIGSTYGGGVLILFLESFLWMFGIHGNNVFDSLNSTIFAFENGKIVTKAFFDTYVLIGGCGSTMCLLIAILIFSRSKRQKKVGYLSSFSMLFNVNEIMVFGIPVVLNPIYAIPFILTPIINFSIAYLATYLGWVSPIVNPDVWWTTPALLSGYQATNSISGSILQLSSLAIGTLIYIPFVKLNNIISEKESDAIIDNLTKYVKECEANKQVFNPELLNAFEKQCVEGIAIKLYNDIQNKNISIFYQPQISDDKIISLEGLLRFRYEGTNYVYPPLLISIASYKGLFLDLTKVIVIKALEDLQKLQKLKPELSIDINVKLESLLDSDFLDWLISKVKEYEIPRNTFGVEITEDAILSDKEKCKIIFDKLHENGITISMDDFSMGNTSISILENNHFDYVKLDGHLVKNLGNERSNYIVSNIIDLGNKLNFEIVAEYVETIEQKELLNDLGCKIYQGYYYYKALPFGDVNMLLEKQELEK